MLEQVTTYISNSQITDVSHINSDITIELGEIKVWISSSWRLESEGTIRIGNDNLVESLSHEDYKEDYNESVAFVKECLYNSTIIEVKYSDFQELTLTLSSGFTFRSFQAYGNDAENFQLYTTKQRYLVYPDKVELEDLGPFYKG
ncbi:MAG: hypothetical protein AAFR87_33825 [Bacteroidota bacterium]